MNTDKTIQIKVPATGSPTATVLRLHPGQTSKALKLHSIKMADEVLGRSRFTNLWGHLLKKDMSTLRILKSPGRDGQCVQDLDIGSPQRSDLRLLTITTSRTQVSEFIPD